MSYSNERFVNLLDSQMLSAKYENVIPNEAKVLFYLNCFIKTAAI
jgi:hypothetical protein